MKNQPINVDDFLKWKDYKIVEYAAQYNSSLGKHKKLEVTLSGNCVVSYKEPGHPWRVIIKTNQPNAAIAAFNEIDIE